MSRTSKTLLILGIVLVLLNSQLCFLISALSVSSSDETLFHAQQLARSLIQRQNIREFALQYGLKIPEQIKNGGAREDIRFDEHSFDWDLNERINVTNHFDALSLNCRKIVVECLYAQKAIKTHFGETPTVQSFIHQKLDTCSSDAKNVFNDLYSSHSKHISDLIFHTLMLKVKTKYSIPLMSATVGLFIIMLYLVAQMNQSSAQLSHAKKENTTQQHELTAAAEKQKELHKGITTLTEQLKEKSLLLNEATYSQQENQGILQFTKDRAERLETEKQNLENLNRDQEKQLKEYVSKWRDSKKQLEQEVSKLNHELNNERKQLKSHIERHDTLISEMKNKITTLQSEITAKSMECQNLLSELNTLKLEKNELETDNKIFESENASLKEELQMVSKALSTSIDDLKSKRADAEILEKHLQDAKQQHGHDLKQIHDLKSQLHLQETELTSLQQVLGEQSAKLTAEISKHLNENISLIHTVDRYKLEIQMKEKEIEEKDQIIYQLKSECINIEDLRTEIQKKSSTLEEKILEMSRLQKDLLLLKQNKDAQEKSFAELTSALKKQNSEYESKISSLNRELDMATSVAARLMEDSNKLKEALEKATELDLQHVTTINELNQKLQENLSLINEKDEEIKQLYIKIDDHAYEIMKKNDLTQKLYDRISSLEHVNASLNSEIDNTRNSYEQLNALKESKVEEINDLKKSITELEQRMGEYEKKVAQSNLQISEQLQRIDEMSPKSTTSTNQELKKNITDSEFTVMEQMEIVLQRKEAELQSLKTQVAELSLKCKMLQSSDIGAILDENAKLNKKLENLEETKQKLMNNYNQEKANSDKLRKELSRLNSAIKKKK
ncbi:hypothetical protein FDP41_002896 [Naegleria fowleri]|uniref:Uncharacterized protein n=1 Tax=Naegleria fowleri TaxID=5763 RepID=A0A6A5BVA9_NAEFO|nr:uncharacterized protein FDP41_002896 [Naegleria fowleri]KAF0978381.1 hypothetical protein FDP41_002896 [Naegleria fowleri]